MKRIPEATATPWLEQYRRLCMSTGMALSLDDGKLIVAEARKEAIDAQYKEIRERHVVAPDFTPAISEKPPEPVAQLSKPTPKPKPKVKETPAEAGKA